MMFLAMMIALSLHQVVHTTLQRQGDGALLGWERWLRDHVGAAGLAELLVLLLPLLALLWVLSRIEPLLFGLPNLLITAAMLFWSLGREDYHTLLERYIAATDGDDPAAADVVRGLWLPCPEPSDDTAAQQRLLYCGFQRWFAPLFYFLALGPVAAVAYRLIQLYAVADRGGLYRDFLRLADWVPVRLLALSFALTGDFVAVVRSARFDRLVSAPALLYTAAAASAQTLDGRGLRDLLYRTAGLWLLLASLLIIAF